MNRRTFISTIAALGVSPAFAEDWPTAPQDIVTKIYSYYAPKNAKGAYDDKQVHARYFSTSLETLVKKAEAKSRRINEPIIDFDPIIGGQDFEAAKNLAITISSSGPDKTTVQAKFLQFGAPQEVNFDFVQENGAWKIFDLRGGTGKDAWSLRKIAGG